MAKQKQIHLEKYDAEAVKIIKRQSVIINKLYEAFGAFCDSCPTCPIAYDDEETGQKTCLYQESVASPLDQEIIEFAENYVKQCEQTAKSHIQEGCA